MIAKYFKVKLDIGIAGYVQADHYVASDGMLQFFSSETSGQPIATYTLASVSSVEEIPKDYLRNSPRDHSRLPERSTWPFPRKDWAAPLSTTPPEASHGRN